MYMCEMCDKLFTQDAIVAHVIHTCTISCETPVESVGMSYRFKVNDRAFIKEDALQLRLCGSNLLTLILSMKKKGEQLQLQTFVSLPFANQIEIARRNVSESEGVAVSVGCAITYSFVSLTHPYMSVVLKSKLGGHKVFVNINALKSMLEDIVLEVKATDSNLLDRVREIPWDPVPFGPIDPPGPAPAPVKDEEKDTAEDGVQADSEDTDEYDSDVEEDPDEEANSDPERW